MAEKLHQTSIRKNTPFLVDNLRAQDISDHLFSDDVLSLDELEVLDVTPGDRAKVRKFIQIIYSKDETAFESLLKALDKTGHGFVKDQLIQTIRDITYVPRDPENLDVDPSQILLPSTETSSVQYNVPVRCSEDELDAQCGSVEQDLTWFTNYPASTQHKSLTDQHLTLIALEISNIDILGSLLGIPPSRIQIHKMNSPHDVTMQINNMLQAWKREQLEGAKLSVLVGALSRGKLLNNQLKQVIVEICENETSDTLW